MGQTQRQIKATALPTGVALHQSIREGQEVKRADQLGAALAPIP